MNAEKIIKELKFKAVRSSGAGGQHVNKVSSKVELLFDLQNSTEFTEEEKELLLQKLKKKMCYYFLVMKAEANIKTKKLLLNVF